MLYFLIFENLLNFLILLMNMRIGACVMHHLWHVESQNVIYTKIRREFVKSSAIRIPITCCQ